MTPLLTFLTACLFVSGSAAAAQTLAPEAPSPLTIETAVALAVARNERAAAAETLVEAADARLGRARSAFFPAVDIIGSYRNDTAMDTRNTLSTAATLSQPIFDARVFPLMRFARLERSATRLTADEQKRLLGYDAADAFLVTLSHEQVLIAAEHRREFARTSFDDSTARFEAGLVSSNDVTRAELEMATAERGVAQARGNVSAARIQLATILNAEVDGALAEPARLLADAASTQGVSTTLVTEAQQRRNDVSAARFRVEALREYAREPSQRFIPSVRLNAQTRNINEGAISDRNNDGFVGVTLNWPLFDAGVRRSEEAERTAIARGAELELRGALRGVEQQLRTAGVQLTSEQAALREATAAVRAARRNADETNELYRQGLASALELADANQRQFEAEVAEVTARYRMAQAYLAFAGGGGTAAGGCGMRPMNRVFVVSAFSLLSLVVLTSCSKGGAQAQQQGGATRRTLEFPVEARPVESRRVEYMVNAVGSLDAFESVAVTSRVTGAVERVAFIEGQTVRQGQPLVEIEPERYRLAVAAAEATMQKQQAARAEAEAGFERRQTASARNPGLIRGEEIETWRTRVQTAAAEVSQAQAALAQAKLNLRDAFVRAPVSGIIQTRTVQTGQYVQPGSVLATLVRRDPLLLRFQIPEQEAAPIRTGMTARFTVGDETTPYTAQITHVAAAASSSSRMVDITANVVNPNQAALRPGAFARVVVPVGDRIEAPVIPQTAIRPSERGFLAFVVENGVARRRVLTLGMRTADGQVEVRDGITAGEMLVIRGAEALRDGVKVKVEGK